MVGARAPRLRAPGACQGAPLVHNGEHTEIGVVTERRVFIKRRGIEREQGRVERDGGLSIHQARVLAVQNERP